MASFRAQSSVAQGLPASTFTEIVFGTEIFDTDNAFASSRFTVPSALNGQYGCFYFQIGYLANEPQASIYLEVSTDGGSNWSYISQNTSRSTDGGATVSGPVLLTTGNIYRALYFGTVASARGDVTTYFSGHTIVGSDAFRARAAATQAVSTSVFTEINFGTELFDPQSVFVGNRFTVPTAWDGKYGMLFAGVRMAADEDFNLYIQVSTNSGSSWTDVAQNGVDFGNGKTINSAYRLMNDGDIYRVRYFGTSGSISNDPRTFFSGYTFD